MLIYDTSSVKEQFQFDLSKANATKCYLTHYANSLYLTFMLQNGTQAERRDALKELDICDRKLKFWERHHNYDHDLALQGMEEEKKKWR